MITLAIVFFASSFTEGRSGCDYYRSKNANRMGKSAIGNLPMFKVILATQ
jgi:hypothetical protein